MGSATSINSSDIIVKSISDIVVESIQTSMSSNDQIVEVNIGKVGGSLNIGNIKVKQSVEISSSAIFDTLNKSEVAAQVNNKIAQLTKSTLDGLNIAQVATSVSKVSNIVENIITMKNKSIIDCSTNNKQKIVLNILESGKDLNINTIEYNQEIKSLVECIGSLKNFSSLKNTTDNEIKSITDASAKGISPIWLVIIFCSVLGSSIIVGKEFLKKLLGPVITIVGIFLVYYGRKGGFGNSEDLKKSIKIMKNISGVGTLIKSEKFQPNDDVISHGEADLYEIYNGQVYLYSNPNPEKILELENDLKISDVKTEILSEKSIGRKIVKITVDGDRYKDIFVKFPKIIQGTNVFTSPNDCIEDGVCMNLEMLESIGRIILTQGEFSKTIDLDHTIYATKYGVPKIKNPDLMYSGFGVVGLGILTTITTFIISLSRKEIPNEKV